MMEYIANAYILEKFEAKVAKLIVGLLEKV